MSNFQQVFSCNLRSVRKAANLTQKEMAEKLNINRSTYTYYETGRSRAPPAILSISSSISATNSLGRISSASAIRHIVYIFGTLPPVSTMPKCERSIPASPLRTS